MGLLKAAQWKVAKSLGKRVLTTTPQIDRMKAMNALKYGSKGKPLPRFAGFGATHKALMKKRSDARVNDLIKGVVDSFIDKALKNPPWRS